MFRPVRVLVIALIGVLVCGVSTAVGSPAYTAVDLKDFVTTGGYCQPPSLPPPWQGSSAFGINNAGVVVGWATHRCDDGSFIAFTYSEGVLRQVGLLSGWSSAAVGINDAGVIAGTGSISAWTTWHAFRSSAGTMSDLGVLSPPGSFCPNIFVCGSWSGGINNRDDVVGWTGDQFTPFLHAFLYQNGEMHDLGTLGGQSSMAHGINDKGVIIGESNPLGSNAFHAFALTDGRMRDLGTLGGANSSANAVNATGDVVGWSEIANGERHAFVFNRGHMRDLGPGEARAINRWGQVVGTSGGHAVIFRSGAVVDLNTMIGHDFPGPLREANGINDSGQIVGTFNEPSPEAWWRPGYAPYPYRFGFLLTPAL